VVEAGEDQGFFHKLITVEVFTDLYFHVTLLEDLGRHK
jgi:hypothetical protein